MIWVTVQGNGTSRICLLYWDFVVRWLFSIYFTKNIVRLIWGLRYKRFAISRFHCTISTSNGETYNNLSKWHVLTWTKALPENKGVWDASVSIKPGLPSLYMHRNNTKIIRVVMGRLLPKINPLITYNCDFVLKLWIYISTNASFKIVCEADGAQTKSCPS